MMLLRFVLTGVAALLASGCEPLFHLSVYNGSGRNLNIALSPAGETTWKPGEYVTFDNYQGTVVRRTEDQLLFEVLDAQGRRYRYLIDIYRMDSPETYGPLRYVGTPGPDGPFADPSELKSQQPPEAGVCMRLDQDMRLYWWNRNCREMGREGAAIPTQPRIFPITPQK